MTLVLFRSFFETDPLTLARALIGVRLLVDGVGGIITETECYTPDDPASHSYCGPTKHNAAMFGPRGHAYVYRVMGLHWCFNVVCGTRAGEGSAVLIRALEPTHGLDQMAARRGTDNLRRLCAGPGCLTQALGLSGAHDGLPLDAPPFRFEARETEPEIIAGPRIGITKAVERPWRFGLAGSHFLSRPFR